MSIYEYEHEVIILSHQRNSKACLIAACAVCVSCMCCAVVFMLYFTFSSNSVTGTTKPAAWAPMLPTHALRAVLQFWWALERGNCWDAS